MEAKADDEQEKIQQFMEITGESAQQARQILLVRVTESDSSKMRARLLSLIARAATAAGKNPTSSKATGLVSEISDVDGVSRIFGNGRAVGVDSVAGRFLWRTGYNAGPRDSRKYEKISSSQQCVQRRPAEDPPAYGHSGVRSVGPISAIGVCKDHASADLSPLKSSPPHGLEQLRPPFAFGPTSRIRIGFHYGDHHENNGRNCVNNDLPSSQNLCPSPNLTKFEGERIDISITDRFILSTEYRLTSSGSGYPYERVLQLHTCTRSRFYSNSGQRIPSVSKKHGTEGSKADGAARHGGEERGAKTGIQMVIPKHLWPYAQLARLDKPIGTWLLAWPCFWIFRRRVVITYAVEWSICLAAPSGSLPDLEILGWFGLGAVLLRGAGCTVNDLLDSDIDIKVERTQQRPIASGALTPFRGLSFLGFQLLLGLGVLLQLNDFSKVLGASSLLLVGTYPLMKRWTFWPQAYLGLAFNWGALLGWAAVHGSLDLSAVLPLYASGVCWTLVYDTIYAHQDKDDDMKVGVKSTALRFGDKTQTWLAGFSTGCVTCLTVAGYNCGLGWPFYAGMVVAAGHLAWQVSTVDVHSRMDCNSKFVSNKWFGAIVCSSIVFGKLAQVST